MQVRVQQTGAFREWVGAPEVHVRVPPAATLRDLLAARPPRFGGRLGSSLQEEGDLADRLLAVAEHRVARGGDALPEEAEASPYPPPQGGAAGAWAGARRGRGRGNARGCAGKAPSGARRGRGGRVGQREA